METITVPFRSAWQAVRDSYARRQADREVRAVFRGAPRPLAETFQELRQEYDAARESRFRRRRQGVSAVGRTGDWHYRSEFDYLRMMELVRDFDRNDMVASQGIGRLVDNVLQDGFRPDPQTGDAAIDTELKEAWRDWATDSRAVDVTGENSWGGIESLVLRSCIVDGDTFCLLTDEGVQLIEAHRPRTPTDAKGEAIIHGVEIDAVRRRRRLWLAEDDVSLTYHASFRRNQLQPFDFFDEGGERRVCQVYMPHRVSQTRGVSCLAPAVDACGMHSDLQFAKLVQAQIVSCVAILEEQAAIGPGVALPGSQLGERATEVLPDGSSRKIEGIAPGMWHTSRPGAKLSGFSPNVPNPEFFPHATLILTFVAINLGLPVAVLLLDPSKTNFSGWRGAIDQARIGFRRVQAVLRERLHQPVWRWWVRRYLAGNPAMERATVASPRIKLDSVLWRPPSWAYIEPNKDAMADDVRISRNLTSRRRVAAARGDDEDELSTEIVEDRATLAIKAFRKAEQINAENPGLEIEWRELAYGQAGGITYTAGDVLGTPADSSEPSDTQEQAA